MLLLVVVVVVVVVWLPWVVDTRHEQLVVWWWQMVRARNALEGNTGAKRACKRVDEGASERGRRASVQCRVDLKIGDHWQECMPQHPITCDRDTQHVI